MLYIGLLLLWLEQFTIDIKTMNDELCKISVFLGYVTSGASVWLIIAVTVERTIVVMFPLQTQRVCNMRYARFGIATIVISFIALNSHFLWTVHLKVISFNQTSLSECMAYDKYSTLTEEVWPWIDAVTYSFLPFIIISLLNSLIVRYVISAKKVRSVLQVYSTRTRRNIVSSHCETSRKITIMLLAISFTFLLTTLPMNIVLIYTSSFVADDDMSFSKMTLVKTIAQVLMYTNHSINFFLYCATGKKFRTQFLSMIRFCRHERRNNRSFSRRSMSSLRSFQTNTGIRRSYRSNDCHNHRSMYIENDQTLKQRSIV